MARGRLRRQLEAIDQDLSSAPDADLVGILHIPKPFVSPARKILMRVVYALLALFAAVLIVYFDRDGYRDVGGRTSSRSWTASITPPSRLDHRLRRHHAVHPVGRLINVLVITPLRVAFLIVLVGTTVETLTTQSRQAFTFSDGGSVRNHTVVVGYGTKGRTAVARCR